MTVLDEIGKERQQISEQLMRLDAERAKLCDQLNELEIAERTLRRFGETAVAGGERTQGRPESTAPAAAAKSRARNRQQDTKLSLNDATLKAVQAHRKGASANEILDYLVREFGMTVRLNHLGMALQRHRRAGRLVNRDQRWYLPPSAKSKRSGRST